MQNEATTRPKRGYSTLRSLISCTMHIEEDKIAAFRMVFGMGGHMREEWLYGGS